MPLRGTVMPTNWVNDSLEKPFIPIWMKKRTDQIFIVHRTFNTSILNLLFFILFFLQKPKVPMNFLIPNNYRSMKKFIPLLLVVFVTAFVSLRKTLTWIRTASIWFIHNYDTKADFKAFETYYLPDSILVIGNSKDAEYWKTKVQEIPSAHTLPIWTTAVMSYPRTETRSRFWRVT